MADPYTTLGVPRDASQDAIRDAYRKLAKQHHPDLNPGNTKAEETFKAVSAANSILSDPEKRGKFDRGEIDASGQEQAPRSSYRDHAESGVWSPIQPNRLRSRADGATPSSATSSTPCSARGDRGTMIAQVTARIEHYALSTSFLDAVNGATRRLTLPDGRTLEIKIPPGTTDGQVLRLRGLGGPGRNGAPAGDALIEVHVADASPFSSRRSGHSSGAAGHAGGGGSRRRR